MRNSAPLPARHLKAEQLAVSRGGRNIVSGLSFSLAPGEALILSGPNGAGKTTLLMCLAGFLRPADGSLAWQGHDAEERPGTDTHFIGHRNAVKPGLTLSENLGFWAAVNGGNPGDVPGALTQAGLDHAAGLDAALLSQGQTRRLALARLLVAPRPVWLLDEPTASLDDAGTKWVAGLIDSHLAAGGLVIAATHLDLGLKRKPQALELGGRP